MIMKIQNSGRSQANGLIALNDDTLAGKIENLLPILEGYKTYDSVTQKDLDSITEHLQETINENYLSHRFRINQRILNELSHLKVPVLKPVTGHAVFVDAKTMLPNIPTNEYPAQVLAIAIYIEGGIRCAEVGSLTSNGASQKEHVQFSIPRRGYTEDQLMYIIQVFKKIVSIKDQIKGCRLTKIENLTLPQFSAEIQLL